MSVLMISALLAVSVIALVSTVRLDSMIAGNKRRSATASLAATSGVNHFMSLNIPVSMLSKSIREHSGVSRVILKDVPLDPNKTFYTVTARICCDRDGGMLEDNKIIIESEGVYTKGDKILAIHKLSATVVELSASN